MKRIVDAGVIAVVRLAEASQLARVADAIKAGGVDAIEFTMTTPGALKIIEATADRFGDEVLLGAGTVLDAETARAAILAGAQFIVSPITDFPSIELCLRYGKVIMPGTFTPTEILRAWQAGADLIKVFPATAVGPALLQGRAGATATGEARAHGRRRRRQRRRVHPQRRRRHRGGRRTREQPPGQGGALRGANGYGQGAHRSGARRSCRLAARRWRGWTPRPAAERRRH